MDLPEGMINAESEAWRKQRRMVMASFAPGQSLRLRDRG
jgi:hypothetical protein